jgi:signal transduction histidine kinase
MAFAFSGLLYLQVTYVGEILRTRSEQFNETAKKCLLQVSKNLELDETRKYIEEDINKDLRNPHIQNQSNKSSLMGGSFLLQMQNEMGSIQSRFEFQGVMTPPKTSSPSLLQSSPSTNVLSASRENLDAYKQRYLHNNDLVHEVIISMLNTADLKPIMERVDVKKLNEYLNSEFLHNGLSLPYVFSLVDKDHKVVYQSEDITAKPQPSDVLTTVLFPNDPPSKQNFIRVYFPTKQNYLFSEVGFIVPSIIFSTMLMVTFIFTLYIVFRQKKLSEMKNDFVNNMTHELKTPVSTISLAAQMLKDSDITKSPDVFRHISGVINDETKRLGFLVEKVLQMSLFERQKTALKLKEIDANDLVTGVANTFVLKVQKYGGTMDVDLKATNSGLYGDEMHLTNVLFNLLDNAVKYRRRDVPLHLMIRTWNEGSHVFIAVEDNGIGIKKEHLKKVFDRFYRVPTGNLHDVKGFGLGLAYVKKMLEDHGGSIRAEVGSGGIGTNFIITLPLIKS